SSVSSDEPEPYTPNTQRPCFFLENHPLFFDQKIKWMYDYGTEREVDRQTRQHYVLKQVLKGNVHVELKEPERILESACGIGMWSFDMAHDYPDCQVIGLDTLPPMENGSQVQDMYAGQTKNLSFHYGSILSPFSFADHTFDLVYQRDVTTLLPTRLWPDLLSEMFRITRSGGKIQLVETGLLFVHPGPILERMNHWLKITAQEIGIQHDYTGLHQNLAQVGYVNIVENSVEIPIGEWPLDPYQKQFGFLYKEKTKAVLKSMKRWWCHQLELSAEEYEEVCLAALKEFDQHQAIACWKIYTAEKP
ncbi:S-adenosyl-L-methionine-dependent methyltransferase, partial [Sporodiniella umbellata]